MHDDNILKLIRIPEDIKVRRKSSYDLLKETGYFELYEEIGEKKIHDVLLKHPELIDSWFRWSEDKRTDSGWFIRKIADDKSLVAYYPDSIINQAKQYSSLIEGCAAFIKREIEQIRVGQKYG